MSHDTTLDGHILSIVQTEEIPEQSDLQVRLKERGFDIPQATLSRRLKKLKIAKVAGLYQVIEYSTPSLPIVLNVKISESGLIVLHTQPGNANSLGAYIDQKYVAYSTQAAVESDILGTIAGDDTLLLIIKSKSALKNVLNIIQEEFPYIKLPL